MNTHLVNLVDALRTENAGAAQTAFERAMAEKVNAALDQQKVAVAAQIYNTED